MNALELLREDHQEVLYLIGELEAADEESGTDPTDTENFNQLKEALKLHAQIEEDLFYPAMEEIEEARGLVEQSYKEHEKIDQLLARLSTKAPNQKEFQEALEELRGNLEQHLEEEEGELFPKAEERLEPGRLDEMGRQMQEMKNSDQVAVAAVKRR